jgi:hypothetical protein
MEVMRGPEGHQAQRRVTLQGDNARAEGLHAVEQAMWRVRKKREERPGGQVPLLRDLSRVSDPRKLSVD